MTPAAAKGLKIGGIILLVLVVLYIIYYFMKGSSTAAFTAMPGKDVVGFDLESNVPSGTLEEDTAHANAIGAVAFLRRGGFTWFKSAKAPITNDLTGGGTLYVKK